MKSPEKLYQNNCRAQQVMDKKDAFMGGLKVRLAGDFLQLPPVKQSSLAGEPQDSEMLKGHAEAEDVDEQEGEHL